MKTAIAWIRDALSSKALNSAHRHYLVRDGFIFATDGRMTAAHPFPFKCEPFCVSGPEFGALIERLPSPIGITSTSDTITLRSGRLSGTIKTMDVDDWPYATEPGTRITIPERMLPALRRLRPFVSDNATKPFAMAIRAANDTLYATNNVTAVAAPEIDLDEVDALIPYWAVDFILARENFLTHWSHGENYMAFHWHNGAWLRTQLIDDKFPDQVEGIINQAGFAGYEITSEWRAAFGDVAELVENIVLRTDKMTSVPSAEGKMDVEHEIGTLIPRELDYSCWNVKFLKPVIDMATHWAPDTYPKPTPFRGEGIVGVIMGRRL